VTSLPARGARLTAGDVLATVSGRPVFLLTGRTPAFRDLGPGMSGRDVAQLERSLRRLGLGPGAVDGFFDAATGDAVARLYTRNGFEPVVANEETLSSARPAEAGLVAGAFAQPGVQLPSDEVVFVGSGPLRVSELPAAVGSKPDGVLATVTGSDVVIDGQLRVEQAGRVHAGAKVLVDEPTLGIDARGRVTSVAGRPGTNGADGFHVSFRVTVNNPPTALVGASVRLTIPIRSTRTAQLTVPVTAVSLGPDGGSRVERSERGVTRFVPIRTGLSADGFVSITPEKPDALAAGDRVVVGFQARLRAGG
jgi:peptidoglycan hydrolase-like protein with peptidoglycan-binding domain